MPKAPVQAFPLQTEVDTQGDVGVGVTNLMTVAVVAFSVGDHTVAIPVVPDKVAWLGIVEHGLACGTGGIDLRLVLPDTAVRHAIEVADGLAFLGTVEELCTL